MVIIDLIFKRVVLLFLVGTVLSLLLIDQNRLKVKTLNNLLPSAENLKEFVYHPAQMDQGRIRDALTYYKFVYDFMGENTYDKPAAAGIVGYAYYYLGDEKNAIDYFSRANKDYGHFFWVNYDLGVIYYNEGHYDQAMNYFLLAKDAFPYTVGFLLTTMSYKQIAGSLSLDQNNFQQSLNQGAESIKELYRISRIFVENPDFSKQFASKKVDLRLF